jgi:hypothetical protein
MEMIGILFYYFIFFLVAASIVSNLWTMIKAIHTIYTAIKDKGN